VLTGRKLPVAAGPLGAVAGAFWIWLAAVGASGWRQRWSWRIL